MADLPTRSLATIVSTIAAGVQGRAAALIDFSEGSTLLAIAEGFGSVLLWMQSIVSYVLSVTRAATSSGVDLDTWVADFGVTRLGAQDATGLVTFSRFTASPTAPFVAVGTQIATADFSRQFLVYADATNPQYSALLNGYTMPANVTTLIVPVAAVVGGSAGNVLAGQITAIQSALPYIDTVTNAAAFINGADSESDPALRRRFVAYILGLARGDAYGLAYAIESTNVNVQYTLTEFQNYADASYRPGYYYVVVDDGSGAPSVGFVATVDAAVQSVRPLGVMASTFATIANFANVSAILTTLPGFTHGTVVAQVAAALATNINSLGEGVGLPYSILSSWIYGVPGVSVVSNLLLNSLSGDAANIAGDPKKSIKAGTITVS